MGSEALDHARVVANSKFKKREEAAAAGERAMAEYQAARLAEHGKIAALKALRLAKEAADRADVAAKVLAKRASVVRTSKAENPKS